MKEDMEIENLKYETWKPIRNWPNYYVSDWGRAMKKGKKKCIILKPTIIQRNYGREYYYQLKSNTNKKFAIDKLVADHFLQNPDKKQSVMHIDGNKANNKANNLKFIIYFGENLQKQYEENCETEVWKDIIGFDNYMISNTGKIINKNGKLISQTLNKKRSIYFVQLYKEKNIKKYLEVDFLIAKHFIDNPNNYNSVMHINKNPLDNSIDNLKWILSKPTFRCIERSKLKNSNKKFHLDEKNEKKYIPEQKDPQILKNKEVWKDVVGFEGFYMVSNFGRIKSISRRFQSKNIILKNHLSKTKGRNNGYYRAVLRKNGNMKIQLVHRLVGIAFIENPNNLPQINHINGNKMDNRVENLEWTDASGNMQHAYKNKFINGVHKLGSKNSLTKTNESEVKKIREMYLTGKYSQKDLAKKFNLSATNISAIITRTTWKQVK